MNRIIVCSTCKSDPPPDLDALRRSLNEAGMAMEVTQIECMGACEQPITVAFQGVGRAAYLFSGVIFPDDIADIVSTAGNFLAADKGWIEDARPCGRLRFCLRARIPAL
ncbi:hypothetical protein B0E33_30645 (plasmid) [Roseibium algicola]|uniref:Metal-binding protein n=2 Tax=Hyphomicrobiales TaxID=356 RepID=A0ABM6ICB0_9HYPH|nr:MULTISPECIES: DUF1636 family protein [Stappiaceae]AQQ08180.1 hypothetical protein B0E33_30645 [Roseibium aggregatum]MBO9463431.1 DUF1636 family protein [Labrenzia sp. R5_0]UES48118.1 DUF1636 domain-containing protein [Roseibium aggregatum]